MGMREPHVCLAREFATAMAWGPRSGLGGPIPSLVRLNFGTDIAAVGFPSLCFGRWEGCFAICHPQKLTGYKDPKSETNLRIVGADTSYKFFHETTSGIPALQKPNGKLVLLCAV